MGGCTQLESCLQAELEPGRSFSAPSYYSQGYLSYIRGLPLNDMPEIFGLHDNANITFAQNETYALLGAIIQLQPKSSSVGGQGREEVGSSRGKVSADGGRGESATHHPACSLVGRNSVHVESCWERGSPDPQCPFALTDSRGHGPENSAPGA